MNRFTPLPFYLLSFSLALVAGLTFVSCRPGSPPSAATPTPWPTLAPLGTPAAQGSAAGTGGGPRLVKHFKADVASGTLAVFPLEGRSGQPVRIEIVVLSGDIEPVVQINNQAGDELATASRGGSGVPVVIGQFQFPVDGYYELAIGSTSGSGVIGASIYQMSPSQVEGGGTFTSTDQELEGKLKQPASYQSYRLPLQRGQRVNIESFADSDNLKLGLELFGPDGALVKILVDTTGANPAIWNFLPAESGAYTVTISNLDEQTGGYSLKVSTSASGGDAVIGSRAALTLSAKPHKSTWLTLPGQALDGVTVEVTPTDPGVDPVISISDPYGHRLTTVDSGGLDQKETLDLVQFPFDGQYQIEFSTKGNAGNVQYYIRPVKLVDAKIGGKIYPAGRAEHGEIYGTGTVIVYTFEAKAGDLVGVDAHATGGTGLDLGFDLYDPDGERLVTRDDVIGKDPVLDRIVLAKSGWYMLTLWNYQDTTGPYEIYVTSPEAPAASPGG